MKVEDKLIEGLTGLRDDLREQPKSIGIEEVHRRKLRVPEGMTAEGFVAQGRAPARSTPESERRPPTKNPQ